MDGLNMRKTVLHHTSARLLRHCAIILVTGLVAGCSGDMTRFTDGITTGSTNNQRSIIQSQNQPYSQAAVMANSEYPAAPVTSQVSSGTVQRNELPPVGAAQASPQYTQQAQQVAMAGTAAVASAGGAVAAAGSVRELVVQPGESLLGVARRVGVSQSALMAANNITDPNVLRSGQKLIIPDMNSAGGTVVAASAALAPKVLGQLPVNAAQTATGQVAQQATQAVVSAKEQAAAVATPVVAKVESAKAAVSSGEGSAGVKPYTPPQASSKVIEEAEQQVASAPSATGISQMRWPVRGRILTSFGQRDGGAINDGIDIMVPEGTAVKAAENGVVIYAGDGLKEFGNTVLVRHEDGLVTVYGHNSKINVQRGQKVRRGEEIARSGMSGNAKAPKLHFEVRKNSTPVNPSKYLES